MSRLADWWAHQPKSTQTMLAVGVPAVALAAAYAARQKPKAAPVETDEDGNPPKAPATFLVSQAPPGEVFAGATYLGEQIEELRNMILNGGANDDGPPVGTTNPPLDPTEYPANKPPDRQNLDPVELAKRY